MAAAGGMNGHWSPHTSDNDNSNGVHNQADNGEHPPLLGLVILCGLFATGCYLSYLSHCSGSWNFVLKSILQERKWLDSPIHIWGGCRIDQGALGSFSMHCIVYNTIFGSWILNTGLPLLYIIFLTLFP